MPEHTKAALIICGFAALILNYFSVDILAIIYVIGTFLLVLRYSDVNRYKPYVDHVPIISKFYDHIIIAPILLCICVTIALGAAIIALWLLWFPVINPLIDEMSNVIDQVVTLNIEPGTWMTFVVLFIIIASTQVFRISMDKLSSGVRRR